VGRGRAGHDRAAVEAPRVAAAVASTPGAIEAPFDAGDVPVTHAAPHFARAVGNMSAGAPGTGPADASAGGAGVAISIGASAPLASASRRARRPSIRAPAAMLIVS